ncbi:MAG: hypothetical protein IPH12_09640 [Saprospirales bacterium]|nr:hypothetical protein [Saprospirales bacterium]
MKQIAFFALALFAFIGMVQLARIFGQEAIAINPTNSTTNQTQFSYHLSTNPVMNKGFGFGAGAPYQQLFWIFGDGNYKWDKGPYYPDDNSTYTFAHGYLAPDAQQFPYETALLVLDRKTDNPPPSRLTPATVSITGTGPVVRMTISAISIIFRSWTLTSILLNVSALSTATSSTRCQTTQTVAIIL